MDSMNQCLQVHKEQRPCFFAGKKKKEEYRSRLNEITDQLVKLNDEDIECREQEKKINENIHLRQTRLSKVMKNRRSLSRSLTVGRRWKQVKFQIWRKESANMKI